MHTLPAATLSRVSELARCSTVFLPGDPARTGRIAYWHPDGAEPPSAPGSVEELAVVDTEAHPLMVRALLVPLREALPSLTRARVAENVSPSAAFWGAATLLALQLASCGRMLPGLTGTGHDAWRAGPLTAEDLERVRTLAASMPPTAHAVPLGGGGSAGTVLLPEQEGLLRDFLDAVADTLPRTPAAPLAAGGDAFAAVPARRFPELRGWAGDVAAGHDAGVRLSLRVEVRGLPGTDVLDADVPGGDGTAGDDIAGPGPVFRAVVQMHSVSDPAVVADAAEFWAAPADPRSPGGSAP
ncbi:ATP-dependent helicase, partial [Streptomyces sp. SID3212]|nr:ATP-dependent helicase [Streptomyces sp. SID3212]